MHLLTCLQTLASVLNANASLFVGWMRWTQRPIYLPPIHPKSASAAQHTRLIKCRTCTDLRASILLPCLHLIGCFIPVFSHLDESALTDGQATQRADGVTEENVALFSKCLHNSSWTLFDVTPPSLRPLFWLAGRQKLAYCWHKGAKQQCGGRLFTRRHFHYYITHSFLSIFSVQNYYCK